MPRYTFVIDGDEVPGEEAHDADAARKRARALGAVHRKPIGIRCDGVTVSLPHSIASPLAAFLGGDAAPAGPRPNWCGPCARFGRSVPAERTPGGGQTGRCGACATREREARAKAHADELRAALDAKARGRKG